MVTLYRTRRLLRTSPEKLKTVRSPVPSPSSDLRLRSDHRLTHPIRLTRICAAANLERTMTMAIKASFSQGAGLLSVFGDSARQHHHDQPRRGRTNSRQRRRRRRRWAARRPSPTPRLIQVFGQGGNDTITLDEANGALPAAAAVRRRRQRHADRRLGQRSAVRPGAATTPCSARAATTCCSAAPATTR